MGRRFTLDLYLCIYVRGERAREGSEKMGVGVGFEGDRRGKKEEGRRGKMRAADSEYIKVFYFSLNEIDDQSAAFLFPFPFLLFSPSFLFSSSYRHFVISSYLDASISISMLYMFFLESCQYQL